MKNRTDYLLAIGGSRHGQLLERYGEHTSTLVLPPPKFDFSPETQIPSIFETNDLERYEPRTYTFKKVRCMQYFVLETLSEHEAKKLIQQIENEPEHLPPER